MREIEFRAWDNEHKCWRYGWLTKLVEEVRRFYAIICDDDEGDLTRYYIHDEKSIGQFTGLKDKNGKKIFEGDIVRQYRRFQDSDGNKILDQVAAVECNETVSWAWGMYGNINIALTHYDDTEVIGNIYENPELLEVDNAN